MRNELGFCRGSFAIEEDEFNSTATANMSLRLFQSIYLFLLFSLNKKNYDLLKLLFFLFFFKL